MSADVACVDSSAFVKLINLEPESTVLRGYLPRWRRLASSALLRVESLRAMRRLSPELVAATRAALAGLDLIAVNEEVLELAGMLDPPMLRSLNAIHLATAQLLVGDLGVLITYDQRLAAAAQALGIEVQAPC